MGRIERLYYAIKSTDAVRLDSPTPLLVELPEFHIRLEGETAEVQVMADCTTADEAIALVGPWLRAYEAYAALQSKRSQLLSFEFVRAEYVGGAEAQVSPHGRVYGAYVSVPSAPLSEYPAPPPRLFTVSPDVETLLQRYRNYERRREPLAAMAYFCLTLVWWRAGFESKRAIDGPPRGEHKTVTAERIFGISEEIQRKLGELTSTKGDGVTARKVWALAGGAFSNGETRWIEAAVLLLIQRLGEYEAGTHDLPLLQMNHLPAFP